MLSTCIAACGKVRRDLGWALVGISRSLIDSSHLELVGPWFFKVNRRCAPILRGALVLRGRDREKHHQPGRSLVDGRGPTPGHCKAECLPKLEIGAKLGVLQIRPQP